MAGKKAFLPEQVLDKAMDLFWEQGYEGVPLLRILFSAWALDVAVCMTPSATSIRSI